MYEVNIVAHDTEETIKTLRAQSLHQAHKIEGGLNINLDHRFYYTEIREIIPDDGQAPPHSP